jgi:hypothetical protein
MFIPLLTAPRDVVVVSGLCVSPKKKMPRRLVRKWTDLASMDVKSVSYLRGTHGPWTSVPPLQVQLLVGLLLVDEAAPLVAIDVSLAIMKPVTRKCSFTQFYTIRILAS